MGIRELRVAGYRSIRALTLPLQQVNVLVGPNGCGKSNLYNAVLLIAKAAQGELARALALEGGMPSVLWAGNTPRSKRGKDPVRITLGVSLEDYGYDIACGLPIPVPRTKFGLDPEVKEEHVWIAPTAARRAQPRAGAMLLERKAHSVFVRDASGKRVAYAFTLNASESVLAQLSEPHLYPELSALREQARAWRFYHQFRTDADAPLRAPQIGVRTPVLSHDGHDLAAALQTIDEIGDGERLRETIAAAFHGAQLVIEAERARFALALAMPGVLRPLAARELSDGTLRFLCLVAALLSPRPPPLLALNEPETSLHPDLLPVLGQLIADAARRSQLWVTTHSQALAQAICERANVEPIHLELVDGATRVAGVNEFGFSEDEN